MKSVLLVMIGLIAIYAISPILLQIISAVKVMYPLLVIVVPVIFAAAMWNY